LHFVLGIFYLFILDFLNQICENNNYFTSAWLIRIFCYLTIFIPLLSILNMHFLQSSYVKISDPNGNASGPSKAEHQLTKIYLSTIMLYVILIGFITLLICHYIYFSQIIDITFYSWICTDTLQLDIGFLFDGLTFIMLFVVVFISLLVHTFSIDYMQKDPHIFRFLVYLSLFTFFMIILITSNNFLQLFVGWEGVGLCSYLLINFWYTRIPANKSALKAIIVNRIGDCGLIFACSLLYANFRTLKYSVIFSLVPYFQDRTIIFFSYEVNLLTFICILLFLAAVGKSAQLGLHTWLPDAMEGPTPVSALIHAATMVTAGVFLIIRCSILFEYSPVVLIFMIVFGGLTAFLGGTVGLFQSDIKKVIAYSTCSQLGYMVFSCGMSGYITTLYHLANHAFFKALLFLSAGVIIHAISDEQDMRKYGNLRKLLPLIYIFMLLASLALCGFPFYAGWYSKDIIIETSFLQDILVPARFCYWLGSLATFFTAFYSFRLVYLTFEGQFSGFKSYLFNFHEPSKLALVPLIFLAFASLFSGYLFQNIFNLFYSTFFNNIIEVLPQHNFSIEFEFLPVYIKLIPLFYTIAALLLTWVFLKKLDLNTNNFLKLFLAGNLFVHFEIFKHQRDLKNKLPRISFYHFKTVIVPTFSFFAKGHEKFHEKFSFSNIFYFKRIFFFFFVNSFYFLGYLLFFTFTVICNLSLFFKVYLYYGVFWNVIIFFHKKWHFDIIYNFFINKSVLNLSYEIFFKIIDKGLLEFFGPQGLSIFIIKLSKYVEFLHIGNLYNMLTYFFYGVLTFVLLFDYILI
jgi:proton-translocating NADH-quinone oxidoreductase chain L